MYIERLHVRHLKLLNDFELSFLREDGSVRLWTVIIGRNGTAKTSILQAIALASAGALQVNGLAKSVIGHLRDRRKGVAKLKVEADFGFHGALAAPNLHPLLAASLVPAGLPMPSLRRLRSKLRLAPGSTTLFGAASYIDDAGTPVGQPGEDPLVDARATSRKGWFVAGYGVSRFLPDPAQSPKLDSPAIERLEPLFRQATGLTSLRFVDHFPRKTALRFVRLLRDALTTVQDLVPDLVGIELRGQGGVSQSGQLIDKDRLQLRVGTRTSKLPAVALSHGYQSTIAWIADLIGQVVLEQGPEVELDQLQGLVLLDEIDLYLHPAWQAGLVSALRKTFPKVQFVATTHSPVVLSGLAPYEIVRLAPDARTGDVRRVAHDAETRTLVAVDSSHLMLPQEADPRTMTGTELYREWFEVDRLLLNPAGKDLRAWLRIATDPFRSEAEHASLPALRKRLLQSGIEPPREPVARKPR